MADKSGEVNGEAVGPLASPQDLGNSAEVTSNGNANVEVHRLPNNEWRDAIPDEEEAAFLRSLGWEEDSGEDADLTEEEINAFYQNAFYPEGSNYLQCSYSACTLIVGG